MAEILFVINNVVSPPRSSLTAPDIGYSESNYGSVTPTSPVFINAIIENSAPSLLSINYNLALVNIAPATSAFAVTVNSVLRTVSLVAISGSKVNLTLSSPVVYGNVVTVAYTKPATNPLQTSSGGQAATITAQSVTNNVSAPIPVYASSTIENASPSVLSIYYNLALANTVPATSAFSVTVNSVLRTVSSVAISGSKVNLTLSTPVVHGNVVTVAYTKPASNPLQTSTGGQAATITAQSVTNNVSASIPVYTSSTIENSTPSVLSINYNLALANIIPATSAFTVTVNSVLRTVSSVAISGSKVNLALSTPVVYGNVVTVAYTKPTSNPLQTSSGGQAATMTAQAVTNNCNEPIVINNPPVPIVNYPEKSFSGFVYEINASNSYDQDNDLLLFDWTVPDEIKVSSVSGSIIRFLAPVVSTTTPYDILLKVSDGTVVVQNSFRINVDPYKPELAKSLVTSTDASSYDKADYPKNAVDGNLETKWTSFGTDEWLLINLSKPFNISFIQIAFLTDQKFESYFDVFASTDNISRYLNSCGSCFYPTGKS